MSTSVDLDTVTSNGSVVFIGTNFQVDPVQDIITGDVKGYNVLISGLVNLNLTNSSWPIDINFTSSSANFSVIQGSFNRDLSIYSANVSNLTLTNCTFNNDVVDANSSNCSVIGMNALSLVVSNNTFYYNGSICLSLGSSVTLVNGGNNVINLAGGITSLGPLAEPRSALSNVTVHLVPNASSVFILGSIADNITFILDGNSTISNSSFNAQCSFLQGNNYTLTFNNCAFNIPYDGANNTYEGVSDGHIVFTNYCSMAPTPLQFNNNKVWNFLGTSSATISDDHSLFIELSDGVYYTLNQLHPSLLVPNVTFELVGATNRVGTWVLGQSDASGNNVLHTPINIHIDADFTGTAVVVTYASDSSIGFQNDSATPLTLNSVYTQTAPNSIAYSYAIHNNSTNLGSSNNTVTINGNFHNNGYNIIDRNTIIVAGVDSPPTYTYWNTIDTLNPNNYADMSLENTAILLALKMKQYSQQLSLSIPSGTAPRFNVTGALSLNNCYINDSVEFDSSNNITITNSNITSANGLIFQLSGATLTIQNSHLYVSTATFLQLTNVVLVLSSNVINFVSNYNLGYSSASGSFSNNTLKMDMSNNILDLDAIYYNTDRYDVSSNIISLNSNSPVVYLKSNSTLTKQLYLSLDSSVSLLNVEGYSGTVNLNQAIRLIGDKLVYTGGNQFTSTIIQSQAGNPSQVMKFSNTTFTGGVSTSPSVYFTASDNAPQLLSLTNTFDINTTLYTLSQTVVIANNTFGNIIVLTVAGSYTLDSDPLVVYDAGGNVYIKNDGSGSLRTLSRSSLLTVNVPSTAVSSSMRLAPYSNGLVINDNLAGAHNLVLEDGSNNILSSNPQSVTSALVFNSTSTSGGSLLVGDYKITTGSCSSAINITNAGTGNVTIGSVAATVFTWTSMTTLVTINNVTSDPSNNSFGNVNRKLNVLDASFNGPSSSLTYFILNKDTMLLNVNVAPATSKVTNNMILWSGLYLLWNAIQNSNLANLTPYSGNGVVPFVEAWDTTHSVAITNYMGGVSSNIYGIQVTNLDNNYSPAGITNNPVPWAANDASNNLLNLNFLSASCVTTTNQLSLVKTFTNSSTSHTGKLGVSPSYVDGSYNYVSAYGWVYTNVDFSNGAGSNNLVLMPQQNNVVNLTVNSTQAVYNNVYTITQDQYINGSDVQTYLSNNIKRTNASSVTQSITITTTQATVNDINGNQTITVDGTTFTWNYYVTAARGNYFNFLNNLTMDIWATDNQLTFNDRINNTIADPYNFTFKGIDNGHSSINIVFNITDYWTNPSAEFTVRLNDSLYATVPPELTKTTTVINSINNYIIGIANINSIGYNVPIPVDSSNVSTMLLLNQTDSWDVSFNQLLVGNSYYTTNYNPATGERVYQTNAYMSATIINSNSSLNYYLTVQPLFWSNDPNYSSPVSRGVVVIKKVDASGNLFDNSLSVSNTVYRYLVTTTITSMRDLNANDIYDMSYKVNVTNVPNSQIPNSGLGYYDSVGTLNDYYLSLYVDLHAAIDYYDSGSNPVFVWNSSTSYTNSFYRNYPTDAVKFIQYVQLSGTVNGSLKSKFTNKTTNTYNVQQVLDAFLVGKPTFSYSGTFNATSFDIGFDLPLDYTVGNYSMNGILDLSNTSIGSFTETDSVWNYLESNVKAPRTVSFYMGKAVDPTTKLESESTTSLTASDASTNVLNWSATSLNMDPTYTTTGSAFTVTPYNKYTKYFIAYCSNFKSFAIDNSNNVLLDASSNEQITFTFKDENNNVVDDVYLSLSAGPNNINNDVNMVVSNTPNSANNSVDFTRLFICRKNNNNGSYETTYANLKIYYTFNNTSLTSSNCNSLNNLGTVLLATINYSSVGLASMNMSQVFLGNWRIIPSGDGQSLLFRYVQDGTNPYATSPLPLDYTVTAPNSLLFSNGVVPHLSVPNPSPQDHVQYPQPANNN